MSGRYITLAPLSHPYFHFLSLVLSNEFIDSEAIALDILTIHVESVRTLRCLLADSCSAGLNNLLLSLLAC
jgi:hypothetical protein